MFFTVYQKWVKEKNTSHDLLSKNLIFGLFMVITFSILVAPDSARSQTGVIPPGEGTSESPYLISEISHLVWMSENTSSSSGKYYTMTADIDAWETAEWNNFSGFQPIGHWSSPDTTSFRGIFDGNWHTILGLVINRSDTDWVGLFGCIGQSGEVRNLGLVGVTVAGKSYVGGLGGHNGGTISNCYATGEVTGISFVGGLVGDNYQGTISNSYATDAVTATGSYGAFADSIGGLVGYHGGSGTVSKCFATGSVTGIGTYIRSIGGLVGQCDSGMVSDCYATGDVTVTMPEGPAVWEIGGLIGCNYGQVSNCYATGAVIGIYDVGGLIGQGNSATVLNSYWDTETSGQSASIGGEGKATVQMKHQATFAGWDFTNVWGISESLAYPYLRSLVSLISGTISYTPYESGNYPLSSITVNVYGDTAMISYPITLTGTSTTYSFVTPLTGYVMLLIESDGNSGWFGDGKDAILTTGTTTMVDFNLTHALPGDADMDGMVYDSDVDILNGCYGIVDGTAVWCVGDFDGDGNVYDSDVDILNGCYGLGHVE